MAKLLVVIPVYKRVDLLNKFENASLCQIINSLASNHSIVLIGPNSLKENYLKSFSSTSYSEFPSEFFISIDGYNRLLKSLSFYKRFYEYEFLLIAQIDAWIFGTSEDLLKFMQYDYSGAISYKDGNCNGYNGGLSLRNVNSAIKALKSYNNYESISEIWDRHFPSKNVINPYKIISFILDVLIRKRVHHRLNFFTKCNEDIFWSVVVPNALKEFKVISSENAIKFSWEHNCTEFYNKYPLPFGCHGWWNYNYEFWKEIIKIEPEVED
jgi:hypothetical protein